MMPWEWPALSYFRLYFPCLFQTPFVSPILSWCVYLRLYLYCTLSPSRHFFCNQYFLCTVYLSHRFETPLESLVRLRIYSSGMQDCWLPQNSEEKSLTFWFITPQDHLESSIIWTPNLKTVSSCVAYGSTHRWEDVGVIATNGIGLAAIGVVLVELLGLVLVGGGPQMLLLFLLVAVAVVPLSNTHHLHPPLLTTDDDWGRGNGGSVRWLKGKWKEASSRSRKGIVSKRLSVTQFRGWTLQTRFRWPFKFIQPFYRGMSSPLS